MTVNDVLNRFTQLVKEGHGDQHVYLDTDPINLYTIGEIDVDSDGDGVIIWKE
jgi:hypothetical protein